jgi:hypothetical protein
VADVVELHPSIAILAPLLGSWVGRGSGEYPTIEPFSYTEEVSIGHTGKPFLTYSQRTRSEDGQPLHAETGYIRMPSPGRIELVVAHPTGVAEVEEGSVAVTQVGLDLNVQSSMIAATTSAKEVVALSRSIRLSADALSYTLQMAAVGLPLQHHLSATLYRQQ